MIPLLIYQQNYEDMGCMINIMAEILAKKKLTEEEQIRMMYCYKLLKNVLEKQLYINANI